MAGTVADDVGSDCDQRSYSGESIAEWKSSEQVENGTPCTSPPYYDTDDDDSGPKPSELYGRFTWNIENFSHITKRELRSNSFDVGGYKWYILIYPQGCDVSNHLSLFLCVANYDKLLPGWGHFAQFTISVLNSNPKKNKYSDTLHKFWKKEHDWGWKKFMELKKLKDEGFIIDDGLIIKAQVQVIRERADRPFRCLDVQYRRELVGVYLSNIDQICRRVIDDRRMKLIRLVDDNARWSSFRAFWGGMDPITKRVMSRERHTNILKLLVKNLFLDKEVTSTLVMDATYSGLRSLVAQKGEIISPFCGLVRVDQDHFVLSEDLVILIEKAVSDEWGRVDRGGSGKDDKGALNRSKLEGNSGEDVSNNSTDHDNRLTELGRKTVEFFALYQIFSRVDVMHRELVALRRQEELIREEEAAGLIKNEKRSKKKQSKQKKNGKKTKDKANKNKEAIIIDITDGIEIEFSSKTEITNETQPTITEPEEANSDASENVSDSAPHLVNWETDASETVNGGKIGNERESLSVDNDSSSSTCSNESCNRGTKLESKDKKSEENAENILNNIGDSLSAESSCDINVGHEQETVIHSVTNWVESNVIPDKGEETKPKLELKSEIKNASITFKTISPSPSLKALSIKKQTSFSSKHPLKLPHEIYPSVATKTEPQKPVIMTSLKVNNLNPQPNLITNKPLNGCIKPSVSVSASSANRPANEAPPAVPTFVPTSYRNAIMGTNGTGDNNNNKKRSLNLELGTSDCKNNTSNLELGTSSSQSQSMFPPLERKEESLQKQGLTFEESSQKQGLTFGESSKKQGLTFGESSKQQGMTLGESSQKQRFDFEEFLQTQGVRFGGPLRGMEFERWRASQNPGFEIPGTSTSGSVSDEFPHLDIINDLLDEDKSFGARPNSARAPQNRTRNFTRQFSMPDNIHHNIHHNNNSNHNTNNGYGSSFRHFSHADLMGYSNLYHDEVAQNHWSPFGGHDYNVGDVNGYVYPIRDYDYDYMISGVNNGFNHPMYRMSNGYN